MIRLYTLGGLRLDAGSASQCQRMRLALLAITAVSGSAGVSRDRLMALLWPESDETRGRGTLKQAVHALRRDLGQPELFLGVDPLRLNPTAITSDVADFEAALRAGDPERAVAEYQGEFLAGFHVPSVEFEEWRDFEQQKLARRYKQALEQLAHSAERDDKPDAAIRWWRALSEAEPTSATVAISLMRVLARAGDRTGAIRHAEVHAAQVHLALDADADVEVLALAESLRRRNERTIIPPAVALTTTPQNEETLGPIQGSAESAPSTVPVAPASGRVRRATVAAGIVAVLALAWLPLRTSDSTGIDLRISGQISAGVDSLLRSKVGTVLLRGIPEVHLGTRWDRVARFRLAITAAAEGDSLWFSGSVEDRLSAVEFAIRPEAGRTWSHAAAAAAEQIAAAIAAARSPLTQRWTAKATLPRNLAGFHEFEAALREWRPPFAQYPGASITRLKQASDLDSTSGSAITLRALILAKHGYLASADSALAALTRLGVRVGPWDNGVTAVVRAWIARDISRAHRAGHELLDSVPGSEWAVIPAYDALGLGYASEAIALLEQTPPLRGAPAERRDDDDSAKPEALTSWQRLTLGQAFYHLGQFDRALAVARLTLARYPEDRIATQSAIKALAGLGRAAEVEQTCRRVLNRSRGIQECEQGIIELRGRGHLTAARRIADIVMESLVASDSLTQRELHERRAYLAVRAGDWATAGTLLETMSWQELQDGDLHTEWLQVLGFRGDTVGVRKGLALLKQRLDPWELAQIAAMSGDHPRATELVAEGFRLGRRKNITLFAFPGLDALHNFPPFRRLVAPLEMADHYSAVSRTVAPR